ncbi:MAG: hypothetical protein K0S22_2403 [Oscillospiraceae bacterium]|nr:hypothetical protein [Oscillospiraceae bacterium]
MDLVTISSISLLDINMDKCYFNPGCAMSIYKPNSELKVLEILQKHLGSVKLHNIYCHHNPKIPKGSTIINNCAGCDRRFCTLYDGVNTISLWKILDSIDGIPLPNHQGLILSVHDSCSFRTKPQVHRAVRNLLHKMKIEVVESQFSGTSSICCGDNLYGRVPLEKVTAFQKKRAAQMPCQDVAVYCVSCIKSMTIGGKTAHYMVDLLLNEPTEPQDLNIVTYHDTLQKYIACH